MRRKWSILALALCVAGCQGAEASGSGSVDYMARFISAFGILLTISNFVWDFYKFRTVQRRQDEDKAEQQRLREQDKKEREEKEKERVDLRISLADPDGNRRLVVTAFNPTSREIHVKAVELFVGADRGMRLHTTHGVTFRHWADIPPRREVGFGLWHKDLKTLTPETVLSEDSVKVVARAPSGEVGLLSGDKVLPYLTRLPPQPQGLNK